MQPTTAILNFANRVVLLSAALSYGSICLDSDLWERFCQVNKCKLSIEFAFQFTLFGWSGRTTPDCSDHPRLAPVTVEF